MSRGDIQPRGRRGRWSRLARTESGIVATGSPFELSDADAFTQGEHFGVSRDQILHDFVISHVLSVLEPLADRFVFYGGTALSRTILDGLRLSEDIDMLSVGPRAETARLIDQAVTQGLQRGFGRVTAELRLPDTRADTTASVYRIGDVPVKMQLIDGQHYTDWPLQRSAISQRYSGIQDVELTTTRLKGSSAPRRPLGATPQETHPATFTTCGRWQNADTSQLRRRPCIESTAQPEGFRRHGRSRSELPAPTSGMTRSGISASRRWLQMRRSSRWYPHGRVQSGPRRPDADCRRRPHKQPRPFNATETTGDTSGTYVSWVAIVTRHASTATRAEATVGPEAARWKP